MIIYDIIWIFIFGNAWYLSKKGTEAWKDKSKVRGFCFILFILNLIIKCVIVRFTKKYSIEGSGSIEEKSLIMADND